MRKFYNPNQLNVAPLVIALIIALIAGGAVVALRNKNITITPAEIYATENSYGIALTAADSYKHLCDAGTLPAGCKATVKTIQADVLNADAAYKKLMGLETNPPAGAAASFLAAVGILQAAIPNVGA